MKRRHLGIATSAGSTMALSLCLSPADPQHVAEEHTLMCDEDSDEAVMPGHK